MCVLKYKNLILQNFLQLQDSMASSFEKGKRKIRSFNQYQYVTNDRKRYVTLFVDMQKLITNT